jgi:hypothetical protein
MGEGVDLKVSRWERSTPILDTGANDMVSAATRISAAETVTLL